MKRTSLITSAVALCLLAALAAAGCYSPRPKGVAHESTIQHKLLAVHHWDVLAADVADQVKKAIDDRDDLYWEVLTVREPGESPFVQAFHRLLVSQLVSRGIQVSVEGENKLSLNYEVLAVRHGAQGPSLPPGSLTVLTGGVRVAHAMETAADWFMFALGAGALLDLARETYVGESPNEVIISSALTFNNRYVVHSSSIYYLDGPELPLYAEPAPPVPAKYHPVTVQVVNE